MKMLRMSATLPSHAFKDLVKGAFKERHSLKFLTEERPLSC